MKKQAFSLMEMMVVLLIVSIILAATAPMVAKKMTVDRRNGGSPWVYTSNNGNIAYNMGGGNLTAIIGASEISGRPNNITPRLIINGSNTQPALAFASDGNYAGQLTVDGSIGAVGISNSTIPDHSVALGMNQTVNTEETVTIGYGAATTDVGAIAIGSGASAVYGGVAINGDAEGGSSIAIGFNSRATAENSVAIGSGVNATRSNEIVLGTTNSTVYIPGNLIVGGNVALAARGSNKVLMNLIQGGTHALRIAYGIAGDEALLIKNRGEAGGSTLTDFLDYARRISANVSVSDFQTTSSDKRLKDVGSKYIAGLEELKKLDFFHYTFKADKDKTPHVGVMAQDLQKVFPNSVTTDQTGYLRIRWDEMFYAVINAVKELDAKITDIVTQIKNHDSEITELKSKIAELEAQNAEYKKQNAEFEKRLLKLEKR